MNIAWDAITQRHELLATKLAEPNLAQSERMPLQKEYALLEDLVSARTALVRAEHELKDLDAQAALSTDPEMQELFAEERADLVKRHKEFTDQIEDDLFPPDDRDDRSVYIEIRAGAGGQEAALFAADLMQMYINYAERRGWKASVESTSQTDLGGFREVVLFIKGKGIYGNLKYESGVHRVQRVPQTETQGRIHTSTVTVAVLPEAKDVDVTINPNDLRIDVYRSGGAGGQHVNTTDSAVRITHIPSGVVVACQDERSQHKNKAKAMKLLQSRILAHEMERHHQEMSKQRKEQVGTGERAEKVRTYNFPQNRVTDHQVNVTLNKLDMVMQAGQLDEIIDALVKHGRESRTLALPYARGE
jgi:peptide chain release factor 1